jgi:hypothetical protein
VYRCLLEKSILWGVPITVVRHRVNFFWVNGSICREVFSAKGLAAAVKRDGLGLRMMFSLTICPQRQTCHRKPLESTGGLCAERQRSGSNQGVKIEDIDLKSLNELFVCCQCRTRRSPAYLKTVRLEAEDRRCPQLHLWLCSEHVEWS